MNAGDTYTPQQLAMFASFAPSREYCRPAQCHYDEADRCWVREGPPAIDGRGFCIGCRGRPNARLPP